MNKIYPSIFGIGNPLVDVVIKASESDLIDLELNKGTMELVDEDRQKEIIKYFKKNNSLYFPGGSAPNTILACSGLGVASHIAGRVGNDKLGDIYINRVNEYGADSGLVRCEGRTGSSIILVTPDGERTMNTNLGVCQEYSSIDIDKEKLSKAKFFYFTGYMWDTDSQKSAIKTAIQIAQENDIRIIFDVADPFAVSRNKNSFLDMIKQNIDIVFANKSELNILFDSEDLEFCVDSLGEVVKSFGIKLGKEGSLIIDGSNRHIIYPSQVLAKDSTGAGDMYAAGFLTSLAKGRGYYDSGKVAVQLAEEVIQVNGAQLDKEAISYLAEKIENNFKK